MAAKDGPARWVKQYLARRGYALTKVAHQHRATMDAGLRAITARQHPLGTVIDIGASDGRWSATAMSHLPPAAYFLIEAQKTHEAALSRFCRTQPRAQFVIAAAGRGAGTTYFKANRPLGGQASAEPSAEHNVAVPMVSVDDEVRARDLTAPFLLKLDTHGFEVPILEGARETLTRTEVIIVESYNFRLTPECLLFDELCALLRGHGFRCIDLVDIRHRPRDGSLWQMNLIFVRDDRPEFQHRTFR